MGATTGGLGTYMPFVKDLVPRSNSPDLYERFKRDLLASEGDVQFVATLLRNRDLIVEISPLKLTPDYAHAQAFRDHGDLFADSHRIEVKGTHHDFTTRWPFRKFFIDEVYKWDQADPKPVLYVRVNPRRTHLAIVKCQPTQKFWRTFRGIDPRTGHAHDWYYLDRAMVAFVRAEDWHPIFRQAAN